MDIWSAYHPSIDLHTIWSIDSLTCLLSCRASSTDRPSDQPPPNDDEFIHLLAYRPVCHGHVALTLSLTWRGQVSVTVILILSTITSKTVDTTGAPWSMVKCNYVGGDYNWMTRMIKWSPHHRVRKTNKWCANCVASRLSVFEIVIRRFIDDGRIGK